MLVAEFGTKPAVRADRVALNDQAGRSGQADTPSEDDSNPRSIGCDVIALSRLGATDPNVIAREYLDPLIVLVISLGQERCAVADGGDAVDTNTDSVPLDDRSIRDGEANSFHTVGADHVPAPWVSTSDLNVRRPVDPHADLLISERTGPCRVRPDPVALNGVWPAFENADSGIAICGNEVPLARSGTTDSSGTRFAQRDAVRVTQVVAVAPISADHVSENLIAGRRRTTYPYTGAAVSGDDVLIARRHAADCVVDSVIDLNAAGGVARDRRGCRRETDPTARDGCAAALQDNAAALEAVHSESTECRAAAVDYEPVGTIARPRSVDLDDRF